MNKVQLINELSKCLNSESYQANQKASVSRFINYINNKSARLEWYTRPTSKDLINLGDIAEQLVVEILFGDMQHRPDNKKGYDYDNYSIKSYISKQPHKNTIQADTLVLVFQQKVQDGIYLIKATDIQVGKQITQNDIVKYGRPMITF